MSKFYKDQSETSMPADVHNVTKENSFLLNLVLHYQNGEINSIDMIEEQIKKEVALLYAIRDKVRNYGRPTIYNRPIDFQ